MPDNTLSIADFDYQGRTQIEARQDELVHRHRAFVESHPELQQCLHDIMEAILVHKPEDPLAFLQDHVQRHREKQGNVSSGI